jgi:hypothetical protein
MPQHNPRKQAFRHLKNGSRYNQGKIHKIDLGLRTGSEVVLRKAFRQFKKRCESEFKCKIEYHMTTVLKVDVKTGEPRYHAHLLWTCPETDFYTLLPLWQFYTNEHASLFVRRLSLKKFTPSVQKQVEKAIKYAIQYNSKQKGEIIRYSHSKGWLAPGNEDEWKKTKQAFYKTCSWTKSYDDADKFTERQSHTSPEWKQALYQGFDAWIDEQRISSQKKKSVQTDCHAYLGALSRAPHETPAPSQEIGGGSVIVLEHGIKTGNDT